MNRVRSTIGESNFSGPGQKRFVVGDEEQQISFKPGQEIDPSLVTTLRIKAQERQEQQEQRILSEARHRIDIITGLGRGTREVPVDDGNSRVIFVLRTLKTFEKNSLAYVIENANRINIGDGRLAFTPTSLSQIKIETLAHSLQSIDGQSVDVILGTANSSYENQILARKELIEDMDGILVDHLYSNYEILTQQTYDGYIPKTVAEAKEVVETISKSGENT